MSKIITIDDFYNNPYEVREHALSKDFKVSGNYPGLRTEVEVGPWFHGFKSHFEQLLSLKITNWPEQYNSAFQITTREATTWVHYDVTNWAAVVYLTPDAPLNSGTALYRHKYSGIFRNTEDASIDYNNAPSVQEDWEKIVEVGNVFNRAVIYNGNYYHRSVVPGFGTCKYTGRLFQTFFFDTE
jgi:hypothetical protein